MHGGGNRAAVFAGLPFGQEAGLAAGQRDEGAGHGRRDRRDPPPMQVAQAVRPAGSLNPGLGQQAALQQRRAQLARAGADQDDRAAGGGGR